jgi:hypothetical protein
MELKIDRRKFEIAEQYKIIEQTERGTGKLELLLLKKLNLRRPTYRLAVAWGQKQIKIRYMSWYMERQFAFGWTSDPSEALRFSEKQATNAVNAILKMSDVFYGIFNWE